MKSVIAVSLYIFSCVLASKPCHFTSELKSLKELTGLNVSFDGSFVFFLMSDELICSVNLDDIYEQVIAKVVEEKPNKTEAVVEFDFFCNNRSTTIHFFSNTVYISDNVEINVALVFGHCDVYLEDFEEFRKYGKIVSVVQSNDSVILLPSGVIQCSFAQHVRMISAKIRCDATQFKRFFWEACENTFEKVAALQLSACNGNRFKLVSDTLVHRFPKVQSLSLHSVDLTSEMTFPWTRSYFDATDSDLIRFALHGNEATLRKAAMGRSFMLYNTTFDIHCLLNLSGKIEQILFNNVQLTEKQSQIFANVTGLYRLDLSQNDLTEIDEFLFEYQTELQEIHLRQNKLTDLPTRLFEHQSKLIYLDISENRLTSVDRNMLKNLRFLQELHLEHNQLKLLPRFFLKEQINSLKYLYLHCNPIISLPEMPFYGTSIVLIDLHGSEITGESIKNLTNRLNLYDFVYAIAEKVGTMDPGKSLDTSSLQRSTLDLSFNKIKHFHVNLTEKDQSLKFLRLIESFDIKTEGNPISCKCELYFVIKMVQLKIKSGITFDWKCMYPEELRGKLLASITEHDLYCKVNLLDCPPICTCYERVDFSSFIVDCRNINMSVLPLKMPKIYPLELWLKNSNLSVINVREYFVNISVLDISYNKLTTISPVVANQLKSVNTLRLDNNHLASLPVQIKFTNVSKIYLDGNAFLCDCHTRWMLDWLHDRLCPVIDWNILTCTDNNKHVRNIIDVPDSLFLCNDISLPSIAMHVIFPSIVIGSIVLVIVVLSLVIYFQRFTVKVLLYIICGFRGFSDKTERQHGFKYDCVIIYAKGDPSLDENSIANNLLDMGYRVADAYKHSVVGFTFFEGIQKLVATSKRVIFCITGDAFENELLTTLWSYSYNRAVKHGFASLIILISDNQFMVNCKDENIRGYLKSGRYINMTSRLLFKRIEYLMPPRNLRDTQDHQIIDVGPDYEVARHQDELELEPETTVSLSDGKPDIFIMFPDELRDFIRHDLIPFLLQNKQNVCVLEDDFMYGNDITEIIHEKLDGVKHVIFILSNQTLHTLQTDSYEGTQLGYILPNILNKAFVCNHNYLLLFTYGVIDVDNIPKDLRKYVNTYITASVNDAYFKERLLEALTYEQRNIHPDREDVDILEPDVDTEADSLI